MKYAIIENNKVFNVVVADKEYADQQGWLVCPDAVETGWLYENKQFVQPPFQSDSTTQTPSPTKEELLAQLQALQTQIETLS